MEIPAVQPCAVPQPVRDGSAYSQAAVAVTDHRQGRDMKPALHRILYIEDDEDIAAVARLTLEHIGRFDVRHFTSGQAAIDAYGAVAPHLILVDVMMPGLDGPATVTRLMATHGQACAPFIFMTARAQMYEQEQYRALGALDVILKPFNPMTLSQTIQEIWDQKHVA